MNEQSVIKSLSPGEHEFPFFTNYGKKLILLHDNLPISVDPDDPFVSIPDRHMAEYLAMLDEQPQRTL